MKINADQEFKPDYRNRLIVGVLLAIMFGVMVPPVYRALTQDTLIAPRKVGTGEYVLVTVVAAVIGLFIGYGLGVMADGLHEVQCRLRRRLRRQKDEAI